MDRRDQLLSTSQLIMKTSRLDRERRVPFQATIYGFLDIPADVSDSEVIDYVHEHALSDGFWNKSEIFVSDESPLSGRSSSN